MVAERVKEASIMKLVNIRRGCLHNASENAKSMGLDMVKISREAPEPIINKSESGHLVIK